MRKIGDVSGSQADAQGEFTAGDPSQDIPPTYVMAAWLNMLQREGIAAIQRLGLDRDEADDGQLAQAMAKILGRTHDGDPNGALAADVLYERAWDTSPSMPVLYVATAADGTAEGTTWQPVGDLLAKAPASGRPHGSALATFSDTQRLTKDADGVLILEDY